MLDVRFLPNPYWIDELRPLTGHGRAGRARTCRVSRSTAEFMERLEALLDVIVPGYIAEGKAYLTIAVGCTGGRHRSVVVADELAGYFRERGQPVAVEHRDVERSNDR